MLLLVPDVYLLNRQDTVMSSLSTPSHSLPLFADLKILHVHSPANAATARSSDVHVCGQDETSHRQCLEGDSVSE